MTAVKATEDDAIDSILDAYEGIESEEAEASDQSSEEIQTFDFDEEFQSRVAALVLRDDIFLKRASHLVKPDYFDKLADKIVVKLALEHHDKFKSGLSDIIIMKQVLSDAIKKKTIRENEKSVVIDRVRELYRTSIENPDYIADKVAVFAKNQAIENAMMQSIELQEKGQFDKMQALLEAAFKVGQRPSGNVYDFFEESDNRAEYREKVASGAIATRGLPTGLGQFDNLLHHRGFGYGELTVYMAAAKRGKTAAIWDHAINWAMSGKNVLGITLEVSTNVLSDRMDANLSSTPMKDLVKDWKNVRNKAQLAGGKAGQFLIHEYPSGSLRPDDVDMLLEDYRAQGITFDAVVVDYLDIMAPNRFVNDAIANSKSVWVDMRGIAQKYDVCMLSATQLNREGAKKATADDTDVAEDYNKIRIADLVLSINATDEELAKGEARIFFAASRNQRGKFSVVVKNNMECMQFMKSVVEIT